MSRTIKISDEAWERIENERGDDSVKATASRLILREVTESNSTGMDYDGVVRACKAAIRDSEPVEAISAQH